VREAALLERLQRRHVREQARLGGAALPLGVDDGEVLRDLGGHGERRSDDVRDWTPRRRVVTAQR